MLKEKNTELSEDLKTMKNVLEENKRKNKAEIKSLNYQNMKLKNLITVCVVIFFFLLRLCGV